MTAKNSLIVVAALLSSLAVDADGARAFKFDKQDWNPGAHDGSRSSVPCSAASASARSRLQGIPIDFA